VCVEELIAKNKMSVIFEKFYVFRVWLQYDLEKIGGIFRNFELEGLL
jgi:hypothetical protein